MTATGEFICGIDTGGTFTDCVVVDADLHKPGEKMTYRYPKLKGTTTVERAGDGTVFVRLGLDGHQFAILA